MSRPKVRGVPDDNVSLMNSLEKLKNALGQGYLLHGSPHLLERIEPRQAHDINNREGGCERGVYAESHDVRVPIVMSLFHPIDPYVHAFCKYSDTGGIFRIAGQNITLLPGYVYILPSASFTSITDSSEAVSYVSVKPINVVATDPSMLDTLAVVIDIH